MFKFHPVDQLQSKVMEPAICGLLGKHTVRSETAGIYTDNPAGYVGFWGLSQFNLPMTYDLDSQCTGKSSRSTP
jgi:hypothetical protein